MVQPIQHRRPLQINDRPLETTAPRASRTRERTQELEALAARLDPAPLRRFIASQQANSLVACSTTACIAANHSRTDLIRAQLGEYTMRVGGNPPFAVPFRMAQGQRDLQTSAQALVKELGGPGQPGTRYAGIAVSGRARPSELKEVVQALANKRPEMFAEPAMARGYLSDMNIGVDCAGFVQNTLAHLAGGQQPFGLQDRGMENLAHLSSNPHFARISNPADARPGDVITLKRNPGDTVGHTVIVSEQMTRPADLLKSNGFAMQSGDHLVLLKVASSWGGGVGPQERTWVFNPRTGGWGAIGSDHQTIFPSAHPQGPYGHEMDGIFHPRKW